MHTSIKTKFWLVLLLNGVVSLTSCKKFLETKSNQKLVVPETIQDLHSLLDDYFNVNQKTPGYAMEESADDFYTSSKDFATLSVYDRQTHIWGKDHLFYGGVGNEWGVAYGNVYRANEVLDEMHHIDRVPDDQDDWNELQGNALFLRSWMLMKAAFTWVLAYDTLSLSGNLGLPLRLDPNFNEPSTRATVQQTYDQITGDFKRAIPLLPVRTIHPFRPTRGAAYAALSRTYLSMRDYTKAGLYADSCLQLQHVLLDYNDDNWVNLDSTQSLGLKKRFNPEVIYGCYAPIGSILTTKGKVDSILYQSYAPNDLRKIVFFLNNGDGTHRFKGSYSAVTSTLFCGIATDEVYLIRAECYARAGKTAEAMQDLNTLLTERWKAGTFVPYAAVDAQDALQQILRERRKELLCRSLRWMDIKRFNKEGANITLKRVIDGQIYLLPPNDPRYALPIPEDVIEISDMKQNPR